MVIAIASSAVRIAVRGRELPGHFENPVSEEPGADRAHRNAENRRGDAQDRIFGDEGLDQLPARRAIGLEHDGIIDAAREARRQRTGENQNAGDEGQGIGAADRRQHLSQKIADRVDRILDAHRRHARKGAGDLVQELRLIAAFHFDGDEKMMRRAFERRRREHHEEVDAERAPVDAPEIGDLGGDVAAQHIDGDRVADLEAQAFRHFADEGNQRRPVIILGPPFAFDEFRAFGQGYRHR